MEPNGSNTEATEMLTPAEAAEYLKVSESTVRFWVQQKTVPFRRAGKHLRFVRSELDEWTKTKAA